MRRAERIILTNKGIRSPGVGSTVPAVNITVATASVRPAVITESCSSLQSLPETETCKIYSVYPHSIYSCCRCVVPTVLLSVLISGLVGAGVFYLIYFFLVEFSEFPSTRVPGLASSSCCRLLPLDAAPHRVLPVLPGPAELDRRPAPLQGQGGQARRAGG